MGLIVFATGDEGQETGDRREGIQMLQVIGEVEGSLLTGDIRSRRKAGDRRQEK